jgi:LPXTG-motif cell wall-anchored protein
MLQRQQIATALIVVLLLGLIGGGLGLLAAPAAASSSAHQDRPTVEPPRPTVPASDWGDEGGDEEDVVYPEPPDNIEGATGGVPPNRDTGHANAGTGDTTSDGSGDTANDGSGDTASEPDVATTDEGEATNGAGDAADEPEMTRPASLPNTGAASPVGFPLLAALGGIALCAGVALRRRSQR